MPEVHFMVGNRGDALLGKDSCPSAPLASRTLRTAPRILRDQVTWLVEGEPKLPNTWVVVGQQ
eukprot:2638451-Rhodomonas_salina.2